MKKFVVIGHPIAHSKSPALHQAGFQEMEIDAEFEAREVLPKDLGSFITHHGTDYSGIAVTLPHKESIAAFVDKVTPAAENIGAINTLYWQEGLLIGTNTDCMGALKAVQTEIPDLAGVKTLILGAGGAARGVIFGMQTAGAEISIWNRTESKADKLAEEFGCETVENIKAVNPDNFDLIINTTSVGLKSWESVLPEDFWSPHHTAFDIVYDPLETKFLADAEAAGATTITGDKMLVFQAIEQFKCWHDIELEPEVMYRGFFE